MEDPKIETTASAISPAAKVLAEPKTETRASLVVVADLWSLLEAADILCFPFAPCFLGFANCSVTSFSGAVSGATEMAATGGSADGARGVASEAVSVARSTGHQVSAVTKLSAKILRIDLDFMRINDY